MPSSEDQIVCPQCKSEVPWRTLCASCGRSLPPTRRIWWSGFLSEGDWTFATGCFLVYGLILLLSLIGLLYMILVSD